MTYAKKSDPAAGAGKIVALYVRVSTGYQADKDSLPFQKKELKSSILYPSKVPAAG